MHINIIMHNYLKYFNIAGAGFEKRKNFSAFEPGRYVKAKGHV